MAPKYPHVEVQLSGEDGNAFAIIARCCNAARRVGLRRSDLDAFRREATSGNYDNVITAAMRWFDCH